MIIEGCIDPEKAENDLSESVGISIRCIVDEFGAIRFHTETIGPSGRVEQIQHTRFLAFTETG